MGPGPCARDPRLARLRRRPDGGIDADPARGARKDLRNAAIFLLLAGLARAAGLPDTGTAAGLCLAVLALQIGFRFFLDAELRVDPRGVDRRFFGRWQRIGLPPEARVEVVHYGRPRRAATEGREWVLGWGVEARQGDRAWMIVNGQEEADARLVAAAVAARAGPG